MAHLTAQCSLCLEQTPLDRPFGYFLFYKQVVVLHFHSGAASREKNDGKVVHSSWQIHYEGIYFEGQETGEEI